MVPPKEAGASSGTGVPFSALWVPPVTEPAAAAAPAAPRQLNGSQASRAKGSQKKSIFDEPIPSIETEGAQNIFANLASTNTNNQPYTPPPRKKPGKSFFARVDHRLELRRNRPKSPPRRSRPCLSCRIMEAAGNKKKAGCIWCEAVAENPYLIRSPPTPETAKDAIATDNDHTGERVSPRKKRQTAKAQGSWAIQGERFQYGLKDQQARDKNNANTSARPQNGFAVANNQILDQDPFVSASGNGVATQQKKRLVRPSKTVKRRSLAKEGDDDEDIDMADTGAESEDILYEQALPKRKYRQNGASNEMADDNEERVQTDVSPDKSAALKRRKIEKAQAQNKVRDSKKAQGLEESIESADPAINNGKPKPSQAMLDNLQKARDARTFGKRGRRKAASIGNLRNVNAQKKRADFDNDGDSDDEADDDAVNPAIRDTSTSSAQAGTKRRRSLRGTALPARLSSAATSTRSSAEPLLASAHLDPSGSTIEYDRCPYYIPSPKQGLIDPANAVVAYDKRKNKPYGQLIPSRMVLRTLANGEVEYVHGYETITIDKAKTTIRGLPDLSAASEVMENDPLAQRRTKRKATEPQAKKQELVLAKVLDIREYAENTSKFYLMVAYWWTRDEVKSQLTGYNAYINKRWPKDKPWKYMLGAVTDVICCDAVVDRVVGFGEMEFGEGDLRKREADGRGMVEGRWVPAGQEAENLQIWCRQMVYGGRALNYEIFGKDVGLEGYNIDGVELNADDRALFAKQQSQSFEIGKQRLKKEEWAKVVERRRGELEGRERSEFAKLWPEKETLVFWERGRIRHERWIRRGQVEGRGERYVRQGSESPGPESGSESESESEPEIEMDVDNEIEDVNGDEIETEIESEDDEDVDEDGDIVLA